MAYAKRIRCPACGDEFRPGPWSQHGRTLANLGIVGLLILCMFFNGCGYTASPQIDIVRSAADRSAGYLARSTKETGMFEYRINMDPTVEVGEGYNIVRHAGTMYAMAMYYQLWPGASMLSAIERAGRYLQESVHPVPGRDDILAVWSEPEVNRSGNPFQAKLGGTGLGLVALLSVEKIHLGFTPLRDLQALGRFIVYMQEEDGSFYSKYIPSMGGRLDKWQSLYYPGEATLGLLMLYEKDGSDVWLESAAKALAYMARSRENKTDIPADHWALLATEKLLSLDELPVSRELLTNHAIQICDTMLQSQIEDPEQPEYNGGFSGDGRTTPTATRLEGLQAALSFLPLNHEVRERIESAVPRGMSFLLRAQITEGEFAGAFPRSAGKVDTAPTDDSNRRVTEVRIDYVQHALSAMIQYYLINDER